MLFRSERPNLTPEQQAQYERMEGKVEETAAPLAGMREARSAIASSASRGRAAATERLPRQEDLAGVGAEFAFDYAKTPNGS